MVRVYRVVRVKLSNKIQICRVGGEGQDGAKCATISVLGALGLTQLGSKCDSDKMGQNEPK